MINFIFGAFFGMVAVLIISPGALKDVKTLLDKLFRKD